MPAWSACRSGVLMMSLMVALSVVASAEDWPGWRGPRGDGTSLDEHPPLKWNGRTGENVAWKTRISGVGHASPIVWQDRVFVPTCLEDTDARVLIALDRGTGTVAWQQTVLEAPLEKRHKLNSRASGTPVTDGQLIFASFLEPDFASNNERTPGNLVVAAYNFVGERQWLVRPGRFASTHGFCSSPVLFEDLVIVNGDHDGDSYVIALDRATGQVRWKFDRKHKTRSYATPIIREIDGRQQLLMSGSKCVVSLDPRTGKEHWEIDGPTEQFVASMVYNGKYAFLTAGFPDKHILAIKPDGRGNVTDSHIAWRTTRNCSYVPSPVICGDYFLVAADDGIASCYVADTGERLWLERMAPHYSASLVSTVGGLVYFLADDGVTKIVRPGKEYDLVAENELGESCYASPAFSDGQIFIRSDQHLYAIGKPAVGK
jgi:outer membrane protein assembly factor BamB